MSLVDGEQATYRTIIQGLEDCGGISRIHMWQLRDANGNDRLGVNVVADIARELRRRHIGFIPPLRNQTQWDIVRLYLKRSSIGELIDSVGVMTEDSDRLLQVASQCTETITRIRELVVAA